MYFADLYTINNYLPLIYLSRYPQNYLNASPGVQTIGSPRILNEVFTTIGHNVFSLNFDINMI